MIDLERIKKERTGKRIIIESLINSPELFLMIYGLKMLLTLHGHVPSSVPGEVYRYLRLVPVNGTLAAIVGLQYISFGLFICLSDGRPPPEDRRWFWRVGRGLLRWCSFMLALWCFFEMPDHRLPDFSAVSQLTYLAGFIVGFIVLQSFLFAMFKREQVKRELLAARCKPLHIWWRPAAYWLWRYWFTWWFPTGFRVIYSDPAGFIHKGYCFVYRSFRENPQWGNRRVQWLADTVTGRLPGAEVWVDNEILRPKLPEWDEPAETNNLLNKPDEPPV